MTLVERVLQYYRDNPGASILDAARGLGAKRGSVATAVYLLTDRGQLRDLGGPINRLVSVDD